MTPVGSQGNTLLVGAGPPDALRISFVGLYFRGERRPDLEQEYLSVYHPIDESSRGSAQLPDSRIVHATALYTTQELQTSVAYNEGLRRLHGQNSLKVPGRAGRRPHQRPSRIPWPAGTGPPRSSRCSPACCPTSGNLSGCGKPWSVPVRWAAP